MQGWKSLKNPFAERGGPRAHVVIDVLRYRHSLSFTFGSPEKVSKTNCVQMAGVIVVWIPLVGISAGIATAPGCDRRTVNVSRCSHEADWHLPANRAVGFGNSDETFPEASANPFEKSLFGSFDPYGRTSQTKQRSNRLLPVEFLHEPICPLRYHRQTISRRQAIEHKDRVVTAQNGACTFAICPRFGLCQFR